MRRREILLTAGIPVALATLGLTLQIPASGQATPLTISVAASMQDAVQALQPLYERQAPEVDLTFNFGSSGSLQRQIEQGAPVDIYLSAAAQQMDALEKQDLIDIETRRDLVINQLVLITPAVGPEINTPQDLRAPAIQQIALGEPSSVPAGAYGEQALIHFDLIDDLSPKFVFGKDVRQILSYVETGNVDAGIVYQTDALRADDIHVSFVFPPELHDPIVYPIAVIKDSSHPEAAQDFLHFLQGEQAQEIFIRFGFKGAERLTQDL